VPDTSGGKTISGTSDRKRHENHIFCECLTFRSLRKDVAAMVRGLRKVGTRHDPDLRDRLYELLEHEHLPHAAGSRFARLIVFVVALDVMAVVLASVPDYDARYGTLFTAIKLGTLVVFAMEYAARLWSVAGHTPRKLSPLRDRLDYAASSL